MTAAIFPALVVAVAVAVAVAVVAAQARGRRFGALASVAVGTAVAAVAFVVADSAVVALVLAVVATAMATIAAGAVVIRRTLAAGRQRAQCGLEALVGDVGVVRRPLDPDGQVVLNGELWRARRSWAEEDEPPPLVGEPVVVDRVQGLTLSVRAAETWEVER